MSSSDINGRSDKETARNHNRFTHHRYQLKNSTKGGGGKHYGLNDQIDQVPGAYAFPKGDEFPKRETPAKQEINIDLDDLEDC